MKKKKETAYFYRNARALARYAIQKREELGDEVVAILFRDSDGTASADRGGWRDKLQSVENGFNHESYDRGVPMIPKPKSEAWVICALRENPYIGCRNLEGRSGNDKSENSLKGELKEIIGHTPLPEELCEMLIGKDIDFERVDMPSFNVFRARLEEVI